MVATRSRDKPSNGNSKSDGADKIDNRKRKAQSKADEKPEFQKKQKTASSDKQPDAGTKKKQSAVPKEKSKGDDKPHADQKHLYKAKLPTRGKNNVLKFEGFPDMQPNLTPKEILQMGSFGGGYFRPIKSGVTGKQYKDDYKELPSDWFEGLDIGKQITSVEYRNQSNRFNIHCGQTLEQWEEQGWIREQDPRGWFAWYCHFYLGRRTDDDERQISRWKKSAHPKSGRWRRILMGKWMAAGFEKIPKDQEEPSPVNRQVLIHWGIDLTQDQYDKFKKEKRAG